MKTIFLHCQYLKDNLMHCFYEEKQNQIIQKMNELKCERYGIYAKTGDIFPIFIWNELLWSS